MSAPSFLMVMAALALVLGAMGVAMRALRKYAMTGASAKGAVKMEIMQRLSLGQRQGLAVVRIGSRVLAVSMGDGGVHQVADLSDVELDVPADSAIGIAGAPMHAIADGIRKFALIGGKSAAKRTNADGRSVKTSGSRIPYIAPIEDFQEILSMAMADGAHA